jgi:hypothetical protein
MSKKIFEEYFVYKLLKNEFSMAKMMGRDSSVGIATGYGLDGPGIKSRWG